MLTMIRTTGVACLLITRAARSMKRPSCPIRRRLPEAQNMNVNFFGGPESKKDLMIHTWLGYTWNSAAVSICKKGTWPRTVKKDDESNKANREVRFEIISKRGGSGAWETGFDSSTDLSVIVLNAKDIKACNATRDLNLQNTILFANNWYKVPTTQRENQKEVIAKFAVDCGFSAVYLTECSNSNWRSGEYGMTSIMTHIAKEANNWKNEPGSLLKELTTSKTELPQRSRTNFAVAELSVSNQEPQAPSKTLPKTSKKGVDWLILPKLLWWLVCQLCGKLFCWQ